MSLCSLMGLGGWTILNMWLSDSKKAQNVALLIQLMEVGYLATLQLIATHCAGVDAVTSDSGVS